MNENGCHSPVFKRKLKPSSGLHNPNKNLKNTFLQNQTNHIWDKLLRFSLVQHIYPFLSTSQISMCQIFLSLCLGTSVKRQNNYCVGARVEEHVSLSEIFSMDPSHAERILTSAENLLKAWQGSYMKVSQKAFNNSFLIWVSRNKIWKREHSQHYSILLLICLETTSTRLQSQIYIS